VVAESVRTLPHSLEAEKSVLGSILRNDAMYAIAAAIITPASFFRKAHEIIFECMGGLAQREVCIDLSRS
jgi:replicative DNA helicase